jgi:hypothetical protein
VKLKYCQSELLNQRVLPSPLDENEKWKEKEKSHKANQRGLISTVNFTMDLLLISLPGATQKTLVLCILPVLCPE